MERTISAKELHASLPRMVERVRRGERFTVLYRSRPAFRIVPIEADLGSLPPLEADPVYRAKGYGRSGGGRMARDHDALLYSVRGAARTKRRR